MHAIRAYGGVEVWHLMEVLSTSWCGWPASEKEVQVPAEQEAGWASEPIPARCLTTIYQLFAVWLRHCTVYIILVPSLSNSLIKF